MKICIDCDDAAINLKKVLFDHLKSKGIDITDLDYSASKAGAMYPEIGFNLAKQIQAGNYDRGISICGTGLGMAMIANKVEGVYAGVCHDVFSAERLRKSNDAQVITMGAQIVASTLARLLIDHWLASEFSGGRSASKVEKIKKLDERYHIVH